MGYLWRATNKLLTGPPINSCNSWFYLPQNGRNSYFCSVISVEVISRPKVVLRVPLVSERSPKACKPKLGMCNKQVSKNNLTFWRHAVLEAWNRKTARCRHGQGRVNREVKTVNWEAGKEGAAETGVKKGLKKAHEPWIRSKNAARIVNWGRARPWSANRELGTFHPPNSSVSVRNVHFMVCAPLTGGGMGFGNSRFFLSSPNLSES